MCAPRREGAAKERRQERAPAPTLDAVLPDEFMPDVDVDKEMERAFDRRRGEILISDLDPDLDGDGRLTRFEKEVFELFKGADVDGSGSINLKEVYGVVRKAAQMKRTTSMLKKLLGVAVFVIGFGIVSAIFGFVLSRRCSTRQHTSTPVPASRVIAQSAELSAINVRTAKDQV